MDLTLKLFLYTDQNDAVEFPINSSHGQLLLSNYKYSATRMGNAPSITGTIKYPDPLDDSWSSNVYVEFRGERYYLKGIPSSSYDNTSVLYSYQVEFESERSILARIYFLDIVSVQDPDNNAQYMTISDSSEFSFSGNLLELSNRLNKSIDFSGMGGEDGYKVVVDDDVDLEDKLFSVSNQTIADVLNSANETFNVPYYFDRKTIHFGYSQNTLPTPLEYGRGKSLLSISKNNTNNDIITKITGCGSDKNVPYYYPNPTPKGFVSLRYGSDKYDPDIYSPKITDFYKFWNFFEIGEVLSYDLRPTKEYVPLMYDFGNNPIKYYTLFKYGYSPDGVKVNTSHIWSYYIPIEKVNSKGPFTVSVYVFDVDNNIACRDYEIISANFYSIELEQGADFEIVTNNTLKYNGSITTPDYASYYVCVSIKFPNALTYRVKIVKDIDPAWRSDRKSGLYQPYDFGVEFDFEPYNDDSIKMVCDYRINTQSRLMPSIYRETNGRERWIYAIGDKYENEYSVTKPLEYIHTDDEIFPTIKNVTNALGQRIDTFSEIAFDRNDSNEVYPEGHKYAGKYKHPYFFAKLRKFDGDNGFNLFQQTIEGEPMVFSFTSGHTASCEFKLAVDSSTMKNTVQIDENGDLVRDEHGNVLCNRGEQERREFIDRQQDTSKYEVWIALEKEDSTMGVMMPDTGSNIAPTANDTFVILGINLPEAYFKAAEMKLDESLIKYLADNNYHKFTYSAKLSSVFLSENEEVRTILNENTRVPIVYQNELIHNLMVESYTYSVNEKRCLPEIEITLNDTIKVASSKSATTSKAINNVNSKATKSQATAISAKNQAATANAKTQSIERRVETLENNESNIEVENIKAQVSANASDISTLTRRVELLEDGDSGADFNEVKEWVEAELESYAKMPTEQPVQDSILIYDSDNETFKGSNVQISTTVQDIEYGLDDKIPTCGQVAEYVEDSVLGKQDVIPDLDAIRDGAGKGATAVQPSELASVAKSGEYGDLKNKPTIPSAVTESTVSGWGFTKNNGNYNKPSSGIPITDLESNAQTALSKTDAIDGMSVAISNLSANKQDTITDIETIRSNAYNGANAKIIASQIFLEMHPNGDLGNGVYVLKDKTGYELHNLAVYKRMVANIRGTSDANNEMFVATLNANIGGQPYMYSALLNCENNELVYGSFVSNAPFNDTLGGSIVSIAADSEVIAEAANNDWLGDVTWKLSSKIVPSKEYVDSLLGGSDVYVAEFNLNTLTTGGRVPITTDFVRAINNNKVILIPTTRGGFVVANIIQCNSVDKSIAIMLHVYEGAIIYALWITNTTPATSAGVPCVPTVTKYALVTQSTLKTINGQSLIGSGNIEISGGSGTTLTEDDIANMGFTKNIGTVTYVAGVAPQNNGEISAQGLYTQLLNSRIQRVLSLPRTLSAGYIYVVTDPVSAVTISGLSSSTVNPVEEYEVHFVTSTNGASCNISPAGYLYWGCEKPTTLLPNTYYELNIVKTVISGSQRFKAVLTPFA